MNLIIIDAKNTLFRFGYAHKYLEDSAGRPTGVCYGLTGELLRLKKKFSPCKFAVVWDGVQTNKFGWRLAHFPQYKQNRINAATDSEESIELRKRVFAQIDNTKELLRILSIPQIEIDHLEADDAIALLGCMAKAQGIDPLIFSTDKDFLQLIQHGCRPVRISKADKKELEDDNTVFEKFRCDSKNLLKVRSLTGDASDGIPSVYPGIGSVRAARLVSAGLNPALPFDQQAPALQAAYSHLKAKWAEVQRNYRVMSLIQDLDDERLTDKQRLKLKKQISAVLNHRPVVDYDEMLEFFGSYELAEALTNRTELYRLHA